MSLPHYKLYIDGQWTDGVNNVKSECDNPATGKPWASCAFATSADVENAVAAARRALKAPEWRSLTATQRGKLIFKLADLVQALSLIHI